MVVPPFGDLGKSARDVFRTGYHYGKGLIKLNLKTKIGENFELNSDHTMNFDASKTSGSIESKCKIKDYGSISEKWTSDGTLTTDYSHDEIIMDGLGLSGTLNYNPAESAANFKLGSKFKNDTFNTSCTIANAFDSNLSVTSALVVGFKEFLIGYQAGYDTNTNTMTKNDLGLAYNLQDAVLHFRCTDIPHEYGLSLFYKASPDWDTAIDGIFAKKSDTWKWTLGAGIKYKVDDTSTLRFKFNKDLQLGTSLQQKLHEGITLALSFNIDCANLAKGGHKVGACLNVEV